MEDAKYKVGDKLICIPGFDKPKKDGGAGYQVGRIFTVERITTDRHSDDFIYWPVEKEPNDNGVYGKAVKLYIYAVDVIPMGSRVRVLDTPNVRKYNKKAIGFEFITDAKCYVDHLILSPCNKFGVNYIAEDLLILEHEVVNDYSIY